MSTNRTNPATHHGRNYTHYSGPIENWTQVFENPIRRYLLHHIQTADGPVTPSTLAMKLVNDDLGTELVAESDGDIERVRALLFHEHVRPLETFGVVVRSVEDDALTIADDVTITVSPPTPSERGAETGR